MSGELPSSIGWRKREEDGMIVVWDLPNGAEHAPMVSGDLANGVAHVEEQWGDLCREIGRRHQLPDGWLQAMIWRESNGNPRAFRQERDKSGQPIHDPSGRLLTGVGLMQITSPALKRNRTDVELFDPGINIETGARYLAELASRPDVKGDFPRAAAAYNAGSVRSSHQNRWGMVMTTGHVDAEVAAYNYWIWLKLDAERQAAAGAVARAFTADELLGDSTFASGSPLPDEDESPAKES